MNVHGSSLTILGLSVNISGWPFLFELNEESVYYFSMRTTIAEKTANNLKIMVAQTVAEILNDHDFGLELSAKARQRLRQAARAEEKTTALSAIKRKHL